MLSKKRTFLAFTVKLLLSADFANAQTQVDSVQNKIQFYPFFKIDTTQHLQPVLVNYIPGNFYAKQLPFFCDKELKVQKAIGFPVKVRVGSVDYVDKMEGKNK